MVNMPEILHEKIGTYKIYDFHSQFDIKVVNGWKLLKWFTQSNMKSDQIVYFWKNREFCIIKNIAAIVFKGSFAQ